MWLVEKFDGHTDTPTAHRRGDTVALDVGGQTLLLDVDEADALRDSLDAALTASREFMHTTGTHRSDGTYVVERRGADSSGNSKVFDSFATLARLADRLPPSITADDLSKVGLTGGRRHMVLWHLVEHPDLPYELDGRQPLAATSTAGQEGPTD